MKTKLFTLALAALTVGLLGSCKKADSTVSVTGVTLDKNELTLTVGGPDVKLTTTVAPETAPDKTVKWYSNKTNIATVDQDGNVHAVAAGSAIIAVATNDGNKVAACAVTVNISVSAVTLDKTELTLTVGDPDVKLTATVAPENATDKTVSWSSDKTDVATIDQEGNVHAVAEGSATITVTTNDGNKTATCAVTVKKSEVTEIDLKDHITYEQPGTAFSYPYYPSWGDNTGKLRILRDKGLKELGLQAGKSKIIFHKTPETKGQIQFCDPNWTALTTVSDWNGDVETLEYVLDEAAIKCVTGETSDGWSETAFVLQGDGLEVTKIAVLP